MVYDIKPLLENNDKEKTALEQILEIGPYTGDVGVNAIGTAFILASFIIFIKLVFPTRANSVISDKSISCFYGGNLIYQFRKNEIHWVDVTYRGIYGTNRVTVKLLTGDEIDIHMIYFPSFSYLERCIKKYGYPKRNDQT